MLEHFQVQGFKSLQSVEVDLAPLVVVFGPNAAGKSNFLEALLLLSSLVSERTLDDAFSRGIRGYPQEAFTLPPGGMEALLSSEQARVRLRARLALAPPRRERLAYEVEVGIEPATGLLSVLDERLQALTSGGKAKGNPVIERVEREQQPGEQRLAIRRRASQSHPIEEPVGLPYALVSNRQFTGDRYPHFDQLRHEIGAWRILYLDPRGAMRQPEPPRDVDDIGEQGQWLVPYLHRLRTKQPKAFAAIRRTVCSAITSITDITTELDMKRGELDLLVRQNEIWLPSRVVSEGTLRVLALCAMAANPFSHGLVAFEEPENGVHPRRIEVVTKLLVNASKARQVVVTTHSPLVVGEIVRMVRQKELDPEHVAVLRCGSGPDGTRLERFEITGPLFADQEIREGLVAADDADGIQAMLLRGWLDG